MAPTDVETAVHLTTPPPRRAGLLRRLLLSLLGTIVLLLVVEGVISVVLAWVDAEDTGALTEEAHCVFDPDLGWVNERGKHLEDLYGPHRHLTTNARGFRGREEIDDAIPEGRYRVLCLGDSFTLGYGVDDASTYPTQLETLAPAIQAVNMGQGGYGVDQCYLWYRRDAEGIEADLLVLAFIAPDFERMLEARFNGLYPKPVLRAEGGALVVPEEPLPDDWSEGRNGRRASRFVTGLGIFEVMDRLGRRKRWQGEKTVEALPVTSTPPPFAEVGALVVRDLARLARERGQEFALVQVPLRDRRAGNPAAVAAWLTPLAAELDVPFVDLTADFDALPPGELDFQYQEDGHLNSHGNRFLAATIRRHLRTRFPDLP